MTLYVTASANWSLLKKKRKSHLYIFNGFNFLKQLLIVVCHTEFQQQECASVGDYFQQRNNPHLLVFLAGLCVCGV